MCNYTEKWRKIWKGIHLSFENWHEKFDKFLKVLKIITLLGSFWEKYTLFELKKYRRVIFYDTEEWCKIWRKTDLWFKTHHGPIIAPFSVQHLQLF